MGFHRVASCGRSGSGCISGYKRRRFGSGPPTGLILLAICLLLLSADIGAVATTPTSPDGRPRSGATAAEQIVVVDTGIDDWRTLVRGVQERAGIVRVEPGEDGLAVLADALDGRSDVRGIHIVSHGEPGAIRLGRTRIDRKTLRRRPHALRTIRSALAPDADILIAGCDTASGATGRSFLDELARATGADVAASTDMTGNSTVGANWDLEARIGEVETRLALSGEARETFQGRLAVGSELTYSFAKFDGTEYGSFDPVNQEVESDSTTYQLYCSGWQFDAFQQRGYRAGSGRYSDPYDFLCLTPSAELAKREVQNGASDPGV